MLRLDLKQAAARFGTLATMVERLNFAEFEWAAVARLGELAVAAILNLTGFGQTEAAGLKSDGTGRAVVRLRFDSFLRAAAGLQGGLGQVVAALNLDRWAQGWLMQGTLWWQVCVEDLWVN